MIRRLLLAVAIFALTTSLARAADVSGKWNGTITFNGESIDLVYDLKADGNTLTGTVEGPAGKLDLEKGKIDGDKISFEITFGDNHIVHEGKLVDGKIKIVSHTSVGDHEYTIAKAANAKAADVKAATPHDFRGVWKGKAELAGGQVLDMTYDLKPEKDKLLGTIGVGDRKIELAEGKLTADGFSFVTTRGDTKIAHEGKWTDGKITITVHVPTGDRHYTLSRVVDIDGLWQTTISRNGNDFTLKYDLKADGDKLTGTVEGPRGKLDIKEGKINGDEISYKVTIGDTDVSYEGKAADGQINLKSHGGPFGDMDYKLTRLVDLSGPWEAVFKADDGTEMTLKFDLKIDGEKLTGSVDSPQGGAKITTGKVTGDEISFDVDFNGNTITHKGKVEGKEIKLKVDGFGAQWDLVMKRPTSK